MKSGAAVMMTWSKAGVIAEALGSVGIVCTLFYSVWSFRTTLRDAYYAGGLEPACTSNSSRSGLERPGAALAPRLARSGQGEPVRRLRVHGLELPRDHLRPLPGLVEEAPARDVVPDHRRRERSAPRVAFDLPQNRCRFKQRFVRFIEVQ